MVINCILINITFSRTPVTVPAISTTASGENMFVTCQFEFALGTYTWRCTHANRFVCEIEKNAVCFKQDCFSLKFFFDVVYVNGGGDKIVTISCWYGKIYVDVVRFSFLSFFSKVIWVLLCMRILGNFMFKCLGL